MHKPLIHVLYGQPDQLSTSYQTRQLMRAARAYFAISERRFADENTGKYATQLKRLWSNAIEPKLHQPEADFIFYGNDGFADLRNWKAKTVVYWYDAPWNWAASPPTIRQLRHWLRYQNIRCADYVFVVSRAQLRIARALRPGREESVHYLPVGVDCEFYSSERGDAKAFKDRFGIPREGVLVGYVGYIAEVEGRVAGQPLIEAASELVGQCRAHFLIVGFGPGLTSLKKLVEKYDLVRSFTFTDYIPTTLLPSAIAAMDICVDTLEPGFHSEARSETKLKQYMAMGRACVATAIGENCVDLANGECGRLVTPGRDSLAKAISELAENPTLREQLGTAARSRALAHYDWPVLVDRMVDALGLSSSAPFVHSPKQLRPLTFCLAEDRPLQEAALRLALVSLCRQCPEADVVVYYDTASEEFKDWTAKLSPRISVITEFPSEARSWNSKPDILLAQLRAGRTEVIWLDSDIIVTRNCASLFAGLGTATICVAQEQISSKHQGTEPRTRGWDLPVGRTFSRTMNTCVLRVTPDHIPLLERWRDLLADKRYLHSQTLPFDERPLHFLGGQDALNGLLGSRDFSDIPVHWIRTGRDVIHSGGGLAYSLGERFSGLFHRIPPFVHGQGTKLWWAFNEDSLRGERNAWWFFRRLLLETSPYFAEAKRYRNEIGMSCSWMDYSTPVGQLNRCLGFGHFALRGLPLTLAATVVDRLSGWRPGARVPERRPAATELIARKSTRMKYRVTAVAFVINGDRPSAVGERARSFATRLKQEFPIGVIFREGNKAWAAFNMFRSLIRLGPRVVYVFDMGFAGVGAGIAHRALFRSKLIIETGDAIYELARSMGRGTIGLLLTRLLQWTSFHFADIIVTRGSFHAELLAKRGLQAVWIPDGVDLTQFAPRKQPQLREKLAFDGKLVVGLIGTSRWSKRLQMCYGWELVEVINILRDQPVIGVLIGDGSGLPKLRAKCKEYGIEDKVLFLGRLPFDQLPDYLAIFDVCLSTQTNDLVGQVRTTGKLPLYLACDRLVLASNVGEAKKILPNNMLVEFEGSRDVHYPARLAERIASLLRDRSVLNQAGAMRKLAELHFDYDLLAKKMGELFVT